MLANLANMFRVKDLRKQILFTLLIIVLYRFGSHLPVPGVSFDQIKRLQDQANSGGVLGFLSLFSGGALTRFAVFGLGIMPYITSSIIIQLLQTVIPKLDAWRQEGVTGQQKITKVTRYVTIVIAIVQASGLVFAFANGSDSYGIAEGIFVEFNTGRFLLAVLTMVAGTALVMWMGELVQQHGIGQGMSIIIFANVVAGLPAGGAAIRAEAGNLKFGLALLMTLALLVAIVFVEQGQRRIPVMFAKRQVGRRMYGGQSSYIPLKVNTAGIIPIIFASSVLYFPVLISNIIGEEGIRGEIRGWIDRHLANPQDFVYILLYGLMIVAFAYFYNAIQFDPAQQADIIRKQGGYIPGIRPGPPTERYLATILNRITLPGSLFLAAIALLPSLVLRGSLQEYPFGGTTILIAVGVALETMKQIDSKLMMRNYEGFLAK